MPVLVEALGHLHGVPGGEAVLAVGLLLQRAGGEGRIGPRRVGLVFQVRRPGTARFADAAATRWPALVQQQQRIFQPAGGRVEVAAGGNAAAVERDQFRLESSPPADAWRTCPAGPSRWPAERHPLPLALDDQPHGNALHPAGRQPRPDLPPQQRRNVVAVEPIDDPPHLLRPHQVVVDLPRAAKRLANGLFGDFMENQPVDGHLRLQDLAEVPTDGLALAVFVRCQVEFRGALQEALQLADLGGLACGITYTGSKSVVDVDAQIGPIFLFVLLGNFLGPCGRSRIWPMLASIV